LVAGKVNSAYFDKTGTLTKQGLDFVNLEASSSESRDTATLGMAVCHTLHVTSEGQLIGNNVDSVAFQHTGSTFVHEAETKPLIKFGGEHYKTLKQYEFDNHRVTQSVVVSDSSGKVTVFVKGSPEAIQKICSSGVSPDFDAYLKKSSKLGIYTLAIASKALDLGSTNIDDITRDDVETDLHFEAFLCFQNTMREETPAVIREILEGDVTVTMITGDNVLTGICIARQAGIIQEEARVLLARVTADGEITWIDAETDFEVEPPTSESLKSSNVALSVTGETWQAMLQNDPKNANLIADYIRVFGRCNPLDKVSVIAHFVEQGRKTLMCGDGGNDCGGLKTAHVGIALSTSEASVVAPFTSLDKEITAVTEVL
jgi:magnesium-transporting ATPase (P-type)